MSTLKVVIIDGWSCVGFYFDDILPDRLNIADVFEIDGRNVSIIDSTWARGLYDFLIDSEFDYILTMEQNYLPKNKWTINQKIIKYERNKKLKLLGID